MLATVGTVIDGKYELLKLIGKGGMSRVYLAMDKRLNKQWAVKEIIKNTRSRNNEIIVQSLIAEANLMKKLDHPTLPRIVDIIENKNTIYVIMDYIEGESLSSELEKHGAQPQELVIEWAKQLGEALDYLHTRKPPIIYRDMKPANVMLKPDGSVKLIDFGIAREYKEGQSEDTVSLGTKGYAAPEQFGGKGQTDERTDVYCLGVTLYHLVTGKNPCEPPYELYPIRHWNPQLSGGLENIILKCTQLNPDDRYQSCAELLYDLDHYEEIDDSYKKKQKNKLKIFSAVIAACLIFSIIGGILQGVKVHKNNSNFDKIISQAEKATSDNEAQNLYVEAIELKPLDIDAYIGLIQVYKEDASFSLEEQTKFMNAISPNLTKLREEKGYVELAFEIGKLYWYYYDYGKDNSSDNQITRMKSSTEWFQDVIKYGGKSFEYYDMAKVYCDIGNYYKDVYLKEQEGTAKEIYAEYFENLQKLLNMIYDKEEENEIVHMELYKLIITSLENYSRKFKANGVPEKDVRNMYNKVKEKVENSKMTTEKTIDMQEYIESRFEETLEAINSAYKKE